MKVFSASDIVGLASSFGSAVPQYKEIRRDEEAYEIAHRWPMLAGLHGFAPAVADVNASIAADVDAAAPAQEKAGLKVVPANSQNAESQCQPPSPPVQIAA